ncbi:polysaccharide deacetylase family protein [Gorillibacterium timonense]|uniref:polysaccharide deacetylase family protein n=1 Tax=Gorillibacterium timonense TaxID=1689269 RepID=UPI00071E4975|nr:polysaccharide deacetylase family protein [Gorillibacterium timonense]
MKLAYNLFPGGLSKALTLSYDDGRIHDRKLIDILNRHGIKSTFHLNSGKFGMQGYIEAEEVTALYSGHEVSVHTVTHPFLEQTPRERIIMEVVEDRRSLEGLAGYPVRGMSYPFGTYNAEVVSILKALGIQYSRTTQSTKRFDLPEEPLLWHPTCHHRDMLALSEEFLALTPKPWGTKPSLFYVWGHSYEFHDNNNWEDIERFCSLMGGRSDIWYATNMEIIDYFQALDRLQLSVDGSILHNPSASPLWVSANNQPVEIGPGQTVRLGEL